MCPAERGRRMSVKKNSKTSDCSPPEHRLQRTGLKLVGQDGLKLEFPIFTGVGLRHERRGTDDVFKCCQSLGQWWNRCTWCSRWKHRGRSRHPQTPLVARVQIGLWKISRRIRPRSGFIEGIKVRTEFDQKFHSRAGRCHRRIPYVSHWRASESVQPSV